MIRKALILLALLASTSHAAPKYFIASQSTLQSGATFYVSSGTVAGQLTATTLIVSSNTILSNATFYQNAQLVISSITFSNPSGGILGETDGGNPLLKVMGAYVSTATLDTVGNNCGSSAQFSDLVSTGVPAGDWDFTFTLTANRGTATQLQFTQVQSGISTTAGNSATGLTYGSNAQIVDEGATGLTYASPAIPSWRIVTTAALTQVYGKFLCTYSGGLPFAYGRLSARRAH